MYNNPVIMMNRGAHHEALSMATFWRRTIADFTRPEERATSLERARYWLGVARAVRLYGA